MDPQSLLTAILTKLQIQCEDLSQKVRQREYMGDIYHWPMPSAPSLLLLGQCICLLTGKSSRLRPTVTDQWLASSPAAINCQGVAAYKEECSTPAPSVLSLIPSALSPLPSQSLPLSPVILSCHSFLSLFPVILSLPVPSIAGQRQPLSFSAPPFSASTTFPGLLSLPFPPNKCPYIRSACHLV